MKRKHLYWAVTLLIVLGTLATVQGLAHLLQGLAF